MLFCFKFPVESLYRVKQSDVWLNTKFAKSHMPNFVVSQTPTCPTWYQRISILGAKLQEVTVEKNVAYWNHSDT